MVPVMLSTEERAVLLKLAREALEKGVHGQELEPLELTTQPPCLQEFGATFVTLTSHGQLRGCIGAIEAYQPLAEDVREHAISAALYDYRFPPVKPEELSDLTIEVSRLTPPQPLEYNTPEELLERLCPGIDGVVIRDGFRRATFLPQVWEKLPNPAQFLSHLCQKMGMPPDLWLYKKLEVLTYQVEEIHE